MSSGIFFLGALAMIAGLVVAGADGCLIGSQKPRPSWLLLAAFILVGGGAWLWRLA